MKGDEIKKTVKSFYSNIAAGSGSGCGCCLNKQKEENLRIARSIGYTEEEIKKVGAANLGLGCGNPTALALIKQGDIVLDLGSGAGLDCLLAADKTGSTGKVIGVDMTPEMIEMSKEIARTQGYKNLEFRLGDIEALPVDSASVDVIISNCVVNLAPNKAAVFREAYRVLKYGGRMYLSDIVLLENLTENQRADGRLIASCVGGALLKNEYIKLLEDAGFTVRIMSEDTEISKRQYQGIPLESIKIEAKK